MLLPIRGKERHMIAEKFVLVPLDAGRCSLGPPVPQDVDPMRQAHVHEVPGSSPAPELARLVREAADRGLVIAVVPAHDEGAFIGRAIRWLAEQSSPPDLIVIRR
jgi:hypothetical protein